MTVNKDGQIFIADETGRDRSRCAKEDLVNAITARGAAKNPGAGLIVKGDKDADFGDVADVMDALGRVQDDPLQPDDGAEAGQDRGSPGEAKRVTKWLAYSRQKANQKPKPRSGCAEPQAASASAST